MKKIYCIEEWIPENDGKPVNDLELLSTEYLSSLEIPVKCGWPVLHEYDDEEKFKDDLVNHLNHHCVIGRTFIKEVPDDYKMSDIIIATE